MDNSAPINNGLNEYKSYFTSPAFIISIIAVCVIVFLFFLSRRFFQKYIAKIQGNEKNRYNISKRVTMAHIFSGIVRVLIVFFGVVFILQINGYSVYSLITGVGLISVILGLAMQDVIKDVICGLRILTDHHFDVGNVILYNGIQGEVIKMSLRYTTIKDIATKDIFTISNHNFSQTIVISNMFDVDINLSYEESPVKIHTVLKETCEQIKNIPNVEDCIYKGTQDFADSAVIYKVRYFCDPRVMPDVRRAIITLIQDNLAANDIKIPYNQLDVHTK